MVESERTALVSERVSRLRRYNKLSPTPSSSSRKRIRVGSTLLLRIGNPGDGRDGVIISISTPLIVRMVDVTDDAEATLDGLVSSTALLPCSKFSVKEGILLRDLVVTPLGMGEVVATFLDDREALDASPLAARPLYRCSRDLDGEQRSFSGFRGGVGGGVEAMLSLLSVFGVRRWSTAARNIEELLAMLLTLSSGGSVVSLLMRLRNDGPIVATK
jgi:hypothetical protein